MQVIASLFVIDGKISLICCNALDVTNNVALYRSICYNTLDC